MRRAHGPPPDNPRAVATRARREAILQAALDVFLERGLFEATVGDIRARSGASTGSLYHHFKGKEGIAFALYLDGNVAIHERLLGAIADDPPAREGVEAAVRAYLDWFAENPRWGLFLFRAADVGFDVGPRDAIRAEEQRLHEHYARWLVPRVDAGAIYRLPPELYVPVMVGPSRDFLRTWLHRPDPEVFERVRDPLARAAWRALRHRPT